MKKDQLFTKPIEKQFEFDSEVAAVFDDMLHRSIPFYGESQKLTCWFANKSLKKNGRLYDLGSSTGSLLLELERMTSKEIAIEFIGIDNSRAMIEHAEKKIHLYNSSIKLIEGDVLTFDYLPAQVIVSNYTLQFIRPLQREVLVKKISDSLEDDGVFIFSEKVLSEDSFLNKELIDIYYDFKKSQGYSEYEIIQKREALENVLIPYTMEENIQMCKQNGFKYCDVVFRWANFATFVARK